LGVVGQEGRLCDALGPTLVTHDQLFKHETTTHQPGSTPLQPNPTPPLATQLCGFCSAERADQWEGGCVRALWLRWLAGTVVT